MHRIFAALLLLAPAALTAATLSVDSVNALYTALEKAAPGDRIVVKAGRYETTRALTVKTAATTAAPLVIAAESIGTVEIAGSHGFDVKAPAANVVIEGFVFTHASGKTVIGSGTVHVRFSRNVFHCTGPDPYLSVIGDSAQIDYNEFRDKKTVGNMISVTGVSGQVARRLWIHHNYFHDFAKTGINGSETIRFGLSGLSMSMGHGIVEHNLFERCVGENELISNKSGGNTYRYNTFINSPGCQLTLRHGNECQVYGNYFRATDGLRIFGDRHQVFSNYFVGNSQGINLGNGGAEVADGAPLTSHDRPDNCVIAFNTLVDNREHYTMNRRTPTALGATNTTFANNILVDGGIAVRIDGPNTGAVWQGNLVWKTKGLDTLPAEGFTNADPKLKAGADGILRLEAGSPAIDSAVGEYAAVLFDFDAQPRSGKKDRGADEFGVAPAKSRLLTAADVGPKAK